MLAESTSTMSCPYSEADDFLARLAEELEALEPSLTILPPQAKQNHGLTVSATASPHPDNDQDLLVRLLCYDSCYNHRCKKPNCPALFHICKKFNEGACPHDGYRHNGFLHLPYPCKSYFKPGDTCHRGALHCRFDHIYRSLWEAMAARQRRIAQYGRYVAFLKSPSGRRGENPPPDAVWTGARPM